MERAGDLFVLGLLGAVKSSTLRGATRAKFEATVIVALETKLRRGNIADSILEDMWWRAFRETPEIRAEWLAYCQQELAKREDEPKEQQSLQLEDTA